ncbi:beta-lactamase class C [Bacillus sp. JCM 19046]|nr:beta-lactamase class C [Bacillus sp. JCM 19045]GAF20049.1 beta-lactamase class C [Bacillus sp. JCM 19046]
MLTKAAERMVEQELSDAKKASILIGVRTKDEQFISGSIHDDPHNDDLGNAVFEIGSTTKTFTSLLLAKCILANKVSLDEPVASYKPEYKRALTHNGKEVTFRNLSTHLSGLPREDMKTIRHSVKKNKDARDNPYKYFTKTNLNQFFLDFDLKQEINKKWRYSNVGIGLLGNTLADILGVSYEEAIQSEILAPLGMNDTFVTGTEEQQQRYVQAYNKKSEPVPPMVLPGMNGAGALKSTLRDMLRYVDHQMGLVNSPLREEIELTQHIQAQTKWKEFHMGLGWFIETKKWSPYPIIHHGGTTMGFHTYCGFMKETQTGIVICSTIQLKALRMVKMLLNLTGGVNENIAKEIFSQSEFLK